MPAPIIAPLSSAIMPAVPSVLAATKGLGSMGLAKFGIPMAGGIMQIPAVKKGMQKAMQPGIDTIKESIDKVKAGRGYAFGYDTDQVPIEVAKERGLAGVVGGFADNMTGNRFDFDKRGESKKQKDTKEFLNKFIFGTQGDAARKTRDEMGGGPITSFSPGERPGEFGFDFPSARVAPNINILPDT